jgi:hypothetical protein
LGRLKGGVGGLGKLILGEGGEKAVLTLPEKV